MQQNANSLANLRLPKKRKDGHGYQYSLPQIKIDELFSLLAEGKSLKKAAKETGVCFVTARKYFREGDPKRGIRPLQWRLTVFQDRVAEKFNVLLEERRIKMLGAVREALGNIEERIKDRVCPACNGEKIQFDKEGLKILCRACNGEGKVSPLMDKSSLKDLERLMRLEVFLCGGLTQKEEERKFLSAEEISGGDNQ